MFAAQSSTGGSKLKAEVTQQLSEYLIKMW